MDSELTHSESTIWGVEPISARPLEYRYTLTIAFHPDFNRIGASAELADLAHGDVAKISRLEPLFSHRYSEGPAKSLDDVYISRKPILMQMIDGQGVCLSSSVEGSEIKVDQKLITDSILFSHERLRQGVVIELGQRIILVLHALSIEPDSPNMHGMYGVSESIASVRRAIDRVADLNVPVLVRGETGTGKELVAAAIHAASDRAENNMVAINVAAIPASLAISELFGAKKGAFTGASVDKPGYFIQANGSTLFLDEIGDAGDEVQVALLRTLETGQVQSVGAKDSVQVDVRLIAATDADLEAKLSESRFRNPLLQRLAGFEIWLPPLAERKPDICLLFSSFLRAEFDAIGESSHYRYIDHHGVAFWYKVFLGALQFSWQGNIREMRNMARQIAINNRQAMVLTLPPRIQQQLLPAVNAWSKPSAQSSLQLQQTHSGTQGQLGIQVQSGIQSQPGIQTANPNTSPANMNASAGNASASLANINTSPANANFSSFNWQIPAVTNTPPHEQAQVQSTPVQKTPSEPEVKRRKPSTVSEQELIQALAHQRWDLKRTAEALNISRPALYKMVDAHPDIRKAGEISAQEVSHSFDQCQGNLEQMVTDLKVSKMSLKRRLKELALT